MRARPSTKFLVLVILMAAALLLLWSGTALGLHAPLDPQTAPKAMIDRFSPPFATLFDRANGPGLPGPNEPIDFDQGPLITMGLAPDGSHVKYYNFDVLPEQPAPIFVLFREGEMMPVTGPAQHRRLHPGRSRLQRLLAGPQGDGPGRLRGQHHYERRRDHSERLLRSRPPI